MSTTPASPPASAGRDGTEREFHVHELFFSTTDHRGVILSGNDVFRRVSGYAEDELIGRPHSIVRHPDMPRVVFRTLWDTIEAGDPIAAYVKNRAQTGQHYWVVATVFPVPDGYLSIRFRPSTPLHATVEGLYGRLRAAEREVEDAGGGKREAAEASAALLVQALAGLGIPDYAAFQRAMLPAEVAARQRIIAERGLPAPDAGGLGGEHAVLHGDLWRLREWLGGLLLRLDAFGALGAQLSERSDQVTGMADGVSMLALNGVIAAQRHGASGGVLGTVARLLRDRAHAAASATDALRGAIALARDRLAMLAYHIAVARLQADMAVVALAEIARGGAGIARDRRTLGHDVAALAGCLGAAVGHLLDGIDEVESGIRDMRRHVAGLQMALAPLSSLGTQGRIEAARELGVGDFGLVFEQVRAATDQGGGHVADLDRVVRAVHVRGDLRLQEQARESAEAVVAGAQALLVR